MTWMALSLALSIAVILFALTVSGWGIYGMEDTREESPTVVASDDYMALVRESAAMLLVLLTIDGAAQETANGQFLIPASAREMVGRLVIALHEKDREILSTLNEDQREVAEGFIRTLMDVFDQRREAAKA